MDISNTDSDVYIQEASGLLEEIETSLLELEENPANSDASYRIFRAMHTIKGSGSMYGFDTISEFAHELETILEMVNRREIPVTKPLIDLIFGAVDQIRLLLSGNAPTSQSDQARAQIIRDLQQFIPPQDCQPAQPIVSSHEKRHRVWTTWKISIIPSPEIFFSGLNPMLILDDLTQLGTCRIEAHGHQIPVLSRLDPELCYFSWTVTLSTDAPLDAIKDVFIFMADTARIDYQQVKTPQEDIPENMVEPLVRLCGQLVEEGFVTIDDFNAVVPDETKIGDLLIRTAMLSGDSPVDDQALESLREQGRRITFQEGIRVPSHKLDHLVNLIGELVITQSRLGQIALEIRDSRLIQPLKLADRLTEDLRNCILNIRMIPIGSSFGKFRRRVRDLSHEIGKQVKLITEGAETELDKTVIERLEDPIIHMIRNSIDHGIELPDERVRLGKPAQGTIRISARQSGSGVAITIADDGRGIDPEKISQRCVEMDLIGPGTQLNQKEALKYIFVPGFSTSTKISDLSGRGVGMDIVKRAVDALGGTIVVDSILGQGTTIRMVLPLTLAIIDGLMVNCHIHRFIVPIALVDECVELRQNMIQSHHGRRISKVRGEVIPFIRLRDLFSIDHPAPDREQMVIVRIDDSQFGIVVDEVIGDHQTVVKSMGKVFKHAEAFSGATIMGNGQVALILDIFGLRRMAETLMMDNAS